MTLESVGLDRMAGPGLCPCGETGLATSAHKALALTAMKWTPFLGSD